MLIPLEELVNRRTVALTGFAMSALLTLSFGVGASAASRPGSVRATHHREVHVDAAHSQRVKPTWAVGVCRGALTEPLKNVATVQYGAVQSCTETVQQQLQVVIQECYRAGPPGNYNCFDAVHSRIKFDITHQLRADAFDPCTPGEIGDYRPEARHIEANYQSHPNVIGTVDIVRCGD